jgi:hypothetical protein
LAAAKLPLDHRGKAQYFFKQHLKPSFKTYNFSEHRETLADAGEPPGNTAMASAVVFKTASQASAAVFKHALR